MKQKTKSLSILLGLLLVTAIAVLGLSSGARASLARLFSLSPLAPPPSPTALRGLESSPLGTPVPLPQWTVTPMPVTTATLTIPPPPGYPTGEPWPPQATSEPPQPTTLLHPFPTPAFHPTPVGRQSTQLQRLWFPYFPDPASSPQLRAVLVDQQGQRWGQEARSIDLRVDPYPPGSVLLNLHPSSNHQWVIADLAFSGSYLIDLASGASRPVITDIHTGPGQFLAWSPDSQHVIILPETFPQEVWITDITSQRHTAFDVPTSEFGYTLVRAVAYSPDGTIVADASLHGRTASKSTSEVEIGIQASELGTRSSLAWLSGDQVIEHSLAWSPDGQRLAIVVVVGTYDAELSNEDIQLWMVNRSDGNPTLLARGLAPYRAAWSPDGQYIAFLRAESSPLENPVFSNIYLLDISTGQEQAVTHFTEQRLGHLVWSPDGTMLAFSVSTAEYGEVWVTTLNGTDQYAIAGPTPPDAPFVWLP